MEQENQNNITEAKEVSAKRVNSQKMSPWTITLIVVAGLVLAGAIAGVGFAALGHKTVGRFERQSAMSEGFGRGMGDRGGMMRDGLGNERVGRNIISGKITAINGDVLTVNASNKDYTINIQDVTEIYNGTSIASKSDLAINQSVTVQGKPNSSGQINANIIEIK